jgi:hypothetical protein
MLLPALNGVARFPINAFPSLLRECSEIPQGSPQNRSAFADYNGFTHYEAHVPVFLTFFLQVRDFIEIVYGIPLAGDWVFIFLEKGIPSHVLRFSPYSLGATPPLD